MSRFLPCLACVVTALFSTTVALADNNDNTGSENNAGTLLPKDTSVESSMLVGEGAGTSAIQPIDARTEESDEEEIWVEISDAIAGLNDVVGDRLFLDLRRKNESEMEVRVDVGFWQRVRYQTRVDLKNDISNIWHLYVRQYYDGQFSSVRFVDDKTDKTIDIFTHAK